MNDKNIALIGFMGAGKSIITNKLASLLGMSLISTDALIEKQEKKTIAEIFEIEGEAHFRQLEKDVLKNIVDKTDSIIDCGGGIVLAQENIDLLKSCSVLIYLKASVDTIFDRIRHYSHRPLMNVDDPKEKIKTMLEERREMYEQADITINTDGESIESICQEITGILKR